MILCTASAVILGSTALSRINMRSADTVVVVPDRQTVVIGGLMQNQKVTSERKVPILGDIPLLGMLFRHKTTDNEKKELLIFLTPYIVNHPGELAARSESEKANVGSKAFTEEELNRYLDKIPSAQDKTSGTTSEPPKPGK